MSIILINKPEFKVDFNQFSSTSKAEIPVELSRQQKLTRAVNTLFLFIKYPTEAIAQSAYTTLKYVPTSFKHIVLGYYGSLRDFRPSSDIYLVAFRVGFWGLSLTWCFTTTTLRLLAEKISPSETKHMLQYFAAPGMNISHIKCEDLKIDTSNVPDTVTVDDLVKMYDEINFTDPNAPGYMPPSTRQEGSSPKEVSELKGHLQQFVSRVNSREAFLATPPKYDTPRLMAFYQQIEDAVRVSIHKVTQNIEAFERANGMDIQAYDEEKKKKYNGLLEDKARLVIDLAIGGNHCGARYMGEAMSTYYNISGDALSVHKNLEETLIDYLAQVRKELAFKHIQTHLGNDTHYFTNYMSNLGKILAIPGSQHIDESLVTSFDRDKYLKLFFAEYNEEFVMQKIQEKIKTSQVLREKLFDWLKDQADCWNVEEFTSDQKVNENVKSLESIINENSCAAPSESLSKLKELLTHLHNQNIELPVLIVEVEGEEKIEPEGNNPNFTQPWNLFLTELFALDEAREWVKSQYPDLKTLAMLMLKRKQIIDGCKKEILEDSGIEKLKESILKKEEIDIEQFGKKSGDKEKIAKMQKVLPINQGTYQHVLNGNTKLVDAVKDYLDQDRKGHFLEALKLEDIQEKGMSEGLMEWLCVSQKLFNCQLFKQQEYVPSKDIARIPDGPAKDELRSAVVENFLYDNKDNQASSALYNWLTVQIPDKSVDESDTIAKKIIEEYPGILSTINGGRYQFRELSQRDILLKYLLDGACRHNVDEVIRRANQLDPSIEPITARFRKVIVIKLPKIIGSISKDTLFKIAATVVAFYFTYRYSYRAYNVTTDLLTRRVIPFAINNFPQKFFRLVNKTVDFKEYIFKNAFKYMFYTVVAKEAILRLPRIPVITDLATRVPSPLDLFSMYCTLFNPLTLSRFIFGKAIDAAMFTWRKCDEFGTYCHALAEDNAKAHFTRCEEKVRKLWQGVNLPHAAT